MTISSMDGYLIALRDRKFRLYSPNQALIGVYDDEEEAKKKAARLQERGAKGGTK